jgi:hypothetical protein
MELQGKKNSAFLVDAGLLCNKDAIMRHNKMDVLYCIILYYTVLFYDIKVLHKQAA